MLRDPFNPEALKNNTITPAKFVSVGDVDYTALAPLKKFSQSESYDETLAVRYRDAAKAELKAEGAKFPVKIMMPYNPVSNEWNRECQIIEQQLERLLGEDFVDVVLVSGPSTGFLGAVRRSGKYALMKCNYGADYADPQTWTEPFSEEDGGNSYGFFYTKPEKILSGLPVDGKSAQTRHLVDEYYALLAAAKNSSPNDELVRFNAFAEAEAHLIEHAFVIPYSVDSSGYVASRIDPFSCQFSPYGLASLRYKGAVLMEKSYSQSEYEDAYRDWLEAWTAARR
jgi:oligopeptide transport system substrate-binding protein